MKKANKALAALLALTMVTGSLAGCGSSNGSGKTETAPATEGTTETADAGASASGADTLVASSAHFEGKFSPFFAASAEDQHIVDMTQIPLLGSDRQGAIVEKGIEGETRSYNGTDYTYYTASDLEMTQNDDGSVYYDVTIRDDLTFSDGTPITIDDVIFSMYVYCDPTYDGSATLYSQPILGMDEYREGMATLSSLIAAAGDRHLVEFMPGVGDSYLKDPETVKRWKFGLTTVDWRKKDLQERLAKSARLAAGEEEIELKPTGEEGIQLIKALCGLTRKISNVNIPNTGHQIANLPESAVVETNAVFERDAIRPLYAGELPEQIKELVDPHVANHERILKAAILCDFDLVVEAFLEDPQVKGRASREQVEELVRDMLRSTAKYLPEGWKKYL